MESNTSKLKDGLQHAAGSNTNAKSLASVAHSIFPKSAQVVADKRFLDDKRRVHDSLVALQVSPSVDTAESALLVNNSRAIDVLERVAANDPSIQHAGAALRAHYARCCPSSEAVSHSLRTHSSDTSGVRPNSLRGINSEY